MNPAPPVTRKFIKLNRQNQPQAGRDVNRKPKVEITRPQKGRNPKSEAGPAPQITHPNQVARTSFQTHDAPRDGRDGFCPGRKLASEGFSLYEARVLLISIFGALALLSCGLTLWQWLAARRFPLHQPRPKHPPPVTRACS